MVQFPRVLVTYIVVIAVIGLALFGFSLWRYPATGDLTYWLLAGSFAILMTLSDRYGLQFRRGTRVHVDTIPILASILLFDPPVAMLIGGLGRAFGRIRLHATPLERVFNVGQTLVYVGVSALLLRAFAPGVPWLPTGLGAWAGLLIAAASMFILNSSIVSGVVAVQTHSRFFAIWAITTPAMLPESSVMYVYGLMTALLVAPHPWSLVLVVVPSVVIFLVLDRTLRTEARQTQLANENAALAADLSKQAGQLRQAYSVLEDALDAKNQMIQNVSHELRTPLVSIMGYSEALQEGFYGDMTDEQLSMLAVIIRNAKSLIRIVNDLLSLQALDRHQMHLVEMDPCDLLNGAIAGFSQRAAKARVELRVTCNDTAPMIWADIPQLEQALDHMIDNAIKFSPNGGLVELRAERQGEQAILITISDHGIGIAPEVMPQIYRRFYQVDGSSTRKFGGQGLGLAIVKRIVELHGGSIRCESQVGGGTTFYISLPVQLAAAEPSATKLD